MTLPSRVAERPRARVCGERDAHARGPEPAAPARRLQPVRHGPRPGGGRPPGGRRLGGRAPREARPAGGGRGARLGRGGERQSAGPTHPRPLRAPHRRGRVPPRLACAPAPRRRPRAARAPPARPPPRRARGAPGPLLRARAGGGGGPPAPPPYGLRGPPAPPPPPPPPPAAAR